MKKILLEDLVSRVDELPVFPQTIIRILEIADSDEVDISEIVREIMKDQGLTATVLKLANSPYYGGMRHIKTVSEACILLGYKVVKNIVFAMAVGDVINKELPGYALEKEQLWRQSQICAITTKAIAKKVRYSKPDLAYTAGLLRDIGKVVMDHYIRDQYQEIIEKVMTENKTFLEVEEEVLGFNHGQVGAKIAEKWNLPIDLIEAIAFHHSPEKAVVNPKIVAITHIADGLIMMMGLHLGVDGLAYGFSSDAMQLLGIDEPMLDQIMSEVADLMNYQQIFMETKK